jgi:hypothetical protein
MKDPDGVKIRELQAEVERLRELVRLKDDIDDGTNAEMTRYRGEVERLRHKLEVAEASEQELAALANHREREVERLRAELAQTYEDEGYGKGTT